MGWLDDLLGKQIKTNETLVPMRKNLNFVDSDSAAFIVEDNDQTGATDVTVTVTAAVGTGYKEPTVESVLGTPTYPPSEASAIGTVATMIFDGQGAIADHDAIRFFGDGSETLPSAGMMGRVTNICPWILDLWPSGAAKIYADGVDLTAGVPVEIYPNTTIFWMVDSNGDFHITT